MISVTRDDDFSGGKTWDDLDHRDETLPDGTTAVINVAGRNILGAPFEHLNDLKFSTQVYDSRVNTTATLRDQILRMKTPPRVFATISGVGYYPYSETEVFDESYVSRDKSLFCDLCRDWEAASVLPKGHPTRRVIIRSGVVIGPGGGIMSKVWLPFFAGLGGRIGSGTQFMPFISLEDLTKMFLFAVEEDHVTGVLNGVAPDIITNQQFTNALGEVMKRPTLLPTPAMAVELLFGKWRAELLLKGMKVVPKRTKELGFQYTHPNIRDAVSYALNSR